MQNSPNTATILDIFLENILRIITFGEPFRKNSLSSDGIFPTNISHTL